MSVISSICTSRTTLPVVAILLAVGWEHVVLANEVSPGPHRASLLSSVRFVPRERRAQTRSFAPFFSARGEVTNVDREAAMHTLHQFAPSHVTGDLWNRTSSLYANLRGASISGTALAPILQASRTKDRANRPLTADEIDSYRLDGLVMPVAQRMFGRHPDWGGRGVNGAPDGKFYVLFVDGPLIHVLFRRQKSGEWLPDGLASLHPIAGNCLLQPQAQGVKARLVKDGAEVMDEKTGQPVSLKHHGGPIKVRDAMLRIAAQFSREHEFDLRLVGSSNVRWTKPWEDEPIPHLTMQQAVGIFDDFARPFSVNNQPDADGNWPVDIDRVLTFND